jgi:hypothetical protein
MPKSEIDISAMTLDELGRVVLSDAMLERVEKHDQLLSAGGSNLQCGGSTNGSCTNSACSGSTNGSCTNQITCGASSNSSSCFVENQLNNGCE